MPPLSIQHVRAILGTLQERAAFQALWDDPAPHAQQFRQAVDRTAALCLLIDDQAPTVPELDRHLDHVLALCVGDRQQFERWILMAKDALHAT